MTGARVDQTFWNGKRVFLTGHTGFKGSWLSVWLASMGAQVTGYSLAPNTSPSIFEILDVESQINTSVIGNINNLDTLNKAMRASAPEIVIHMAAQPLVRYSYANPLETYTTNVLGTAHVLEVVRQISDIRATLIVTTDKCYENKEHGVEFKESDSLGGYDPYSSSKACAELVTAAYRQSYFTEKQKNSFRTAIATARAGNVIGGGDWSCDRLIPDAIRAFNHDEPVIIRNPQAIRPWQHVIEPLSGYLLLLENLFQHGDKFASAWNFGPQDSDTLSVSSVIEMMTKRWHRKASWRVVDAEQPHEAQLLRLDCRKAKERLDWSPRWSLEIAIEKTAEWHQAHHAQADMLALSLTQIAQHQTASQ
jgi:CDP-glucose 4,6-dehydratase